MKNLSIMEPHFTETVNVCLRSKKNLYGSIVEIKKTIFNESISYIIALL